MDDLDDVRAYLGYDKINVYGGSYGTRAGLVYMRQHGDRVRTAVLDGVAPTNMRLPLFFPRDVQRAFDRLIADCAADAACNARYPNLGARARALVERLEKNPPLVRVVHPRTGEHGEIRMTARILANVFAQTLYQPSGGVAAAGPDRTRRAERFPGRAGADGWWRRSGGPRTWPSACSSRCICAEDAPRISAEEAKKEADGTLFGPHVMRMQREACAFWPRGNVDASFYEPVQSSIPTLIMSGEIDPVTPPVWGEAIAKTLPNSKHIVMPGTGHTAGGTGCGRRLIKAFIDAGTTENLDTSCVAKQARPPILRHTRRVRIPQPEKNHEGRRRMIRVENLHKRFGEVRAVDGVSFAAPDGQVTALLGPNGAGKTTTLRMLYTLMRPDDGKILVDGIDAGVDPQGARFALGVLPDQSGLYPRLTAREHIEYFGELQGITGADLRRRIDQLLTLLDMTEIADRRVAGFSHGERTKTALARAIVHNPKNVLLDEPTNGLDVMSTRAVREIIRRLKGEGHTVLFSSHVMQEVSALCDTMVVIARGQIVAAGSPDDLRRQTGHENLEDAFVALSGLEAEASPS